MLKTIDGISSNKGNAIDLILLFFILFALVYPLHSIISHYTFGDQTHYRLFYERLADVSSAEGVFSLAQVLVSSREVVSPIVLWFGSYMGIDKDVYITGLNLMLMAALVVFLRKNKAGWTVVLLCLANFYLIVLFTGAERLKIGYLFVLLAGLSGGKVRVVMMTLAMLSHFQMILMVAGLVIYFKSDEFAVGLKGVALSLRIKFKHALGFASMLLVVAVFFLVPGVVEGIVLKATGYLRADMFVLANFLQYLALSVCFISCREFKVNLNVILFLIFFLAAIGVLGGQRANMIFFTSALSVLVIEKKLSVRSVHSWPFMLILVYFSYKSVDFVKNIYMHGDGFYGL